jgi:hypothetical protein
MAACVITQKIVSRNTYHENKFIAVHAIEPYNF